MLPSGLSRQLAAITSLLLMAASVIAASVVGIQQFPRGVAVLLCIVAALAAAWWALTRRGAARSVGAAGAAMWLAGALALVASERGVVENALILTTFLGSIVAARRVFTVPVTLRVVPPPRRPVLFYNPKSGGGKAVRFNVMREAHARGITAIELQPGDDVGALVRAVIDDGADAVGVAGGDGTQAAVAAIAADRGLPYVCVPAGTRNHFALDLGVDRNDVVGALDAFTHGAERVVDLAEVNGRVFVNNVSLGLYAEAVQSDSYRGAKLRTLADTAPDVLRRGEHGLDLRWTGSDGHEHSTAAVLLISNDAYRLGRVLGTGTRPCLDAGVLGITAAGAGAAAAKKPIAAWSAATFEVRSDGPVAAGIDGEAARLDPPLRFRSRPQSLRVLIAPHHPGASPSASIPAGRWDTVRAIARVAVRGSY